MDKETFVSFAIIVFYDIVAEDNNGKRGARRKGWIRLNFL